MNVWRLFQGQQGGQGNGDLAHAANNEGKANDANNTEQGGVGHGQVAVATAGAVVGGAAAGPLATATLGATGFGSLGPVAGSWAAFVQGPATASGSVFALCQSAGITGALSTPVLLGTGVITGGAGALLGVAAYGAYNHYFAANANTAIEKKESGQQDSAQQNNYKRKRSLGFLAQYIPGLVPEQQSRIIQHLEALGIQTELDFVSYLGKHLKHRL